MTRLLVLNRRGGLIAVLALIFLFSFGPTAIAQNADLGIIKSSNSSTVVAGTDVPYDVSVSNFSGETSTPTNTVTDNLPAGMTFVSETHPAGWTCLTPAVGAGGTITCTSDSPIFDESSTTFNFVFHLDASVPNGTMITNTATISHAGSDPNSENNSASVTVTVGAAPSPPLLQHDVLISEFRLSGPGGSSDEYIEFYCNRDSNCDISNAFIRAFDPEFGDFSISFPSGTVIQARQFLLVADLTQYSLPVYATPDFDVHTPSVPDFFIDNEGLQLVGPDEPIILDSVGFIGGGNDAQYIEGTGLQRATGARPADQYAYVRRREAGPLVDTDNNANDFVLVSVTGAAHPGITAPPVLGAPGPQSRTSPTSYNNAQFPNSLVEPANDAHTTPNRVRTGTGNTGTLSIRRSLTNNTTETFDYVSFRVIDIPTLNSPNPLGDRAQLRLITSPDAETFTNTQGRTVVIRGTILEFDAGSGVEPEQPNGGGLNTTVRANLAQEVISPGETVDVQFLLNVVQAGNYRFYVFVEATPGSFKGDAPTTATRSRVDSTTATAAPPRMVNLKRSATAIGPSTTRPKPNPLATTKSTNGGAPVLIIRPMINWPIVSTPSSKKRQKRKVKVRRRSSAALRAKAESKYRGETPAVQN